MKKEYRQVFEVILDARNNTEAKEIALKLTRALEQCISDYAIDAQVDGVHIENEEGETI